jgi:hypothetical protein
MTTLILEDANDLQEMFDGIAEDFAKTDYIAYLAGELDRLADLHKSFFDSSSGPDGNAWKPNAPRTIAQKGHSTVLRGVRTRKDRNIKGTKGRAGVKFRRSRWIGGYPLATSLTAKTGQSYGDAIREAVGKQGSGALTFGTSVPYAVYNDQGTERIPARPHVGMNDQFLDAMVERLADYQIKQLME